MALSKDYIKKINYYCNDNIAIYANIDSSIAGSLQKELTIPNAYIKIVKIEGDKARIFLTINILDKKDGVIMEVDYFDFVPDVTNNSDNFIKQGYEQLKANKYQGAVDLFDAGQVV